MTAATTKILGLALANGFVAVSGAVYSNLYMQYDNTSGSGKVVLALASVIIGTAVFSRIKFIKDTTAVILGAIVYSLCLNYLVLIDKNGIYLKLLNAVMFTLILIFNEKTRGARAEALKSEGRCGKTMIELKNIKKIYNPGTVSQMCLFDGFFAFGK